MKKIMLLVLLIVVFAGCVNEVAVEKQCSADSDCVPATCCHPSEAVNEDYAPDCSDVFCTLECAPETLDCGQGEVKCVRGECQAIID